MESKFTKGPWFVRLCDDRMSMNMTVVTTIDYSDKGHNYHEDTDDDTVCIVFHQITPTVSCGKDDFGDANAKLIAAAPDMLEALQQGAELMEYLINATPTGKVRDTMCDFNIIARSAIAKALD